MANFCGHCGASNAGGAFCASCGRPLDAGAPSRDPAEQTVVRPPVGDEPTTPPPATPATPALAPEPEPDPTRRFPTSPPPPPAPQQSWGQPPTAPPAAPPGYPVAPSYPPQQPQAPSTPSTPKVNPFEGWPVADYVRDGAAVFAFIACLGMPWDLNNDASYLSGLDLFNHGVERWWVVIAVLLGVVSLAVPYLAKAGTVPGWSAQRYRLTKLALNVPFVLSVIVAVLIEVIHVNDPLAGGLGSGIGMGLAAVALAVQPRQSEDPQGTDDRLWNRVARITTMAAVGLTVVLFLLWFLHGAVSNDVDIFDPFAGFLAVIVACLAMPLVVVGWPAFGTLADGGSAPWRRVLATSGFSVVVIALLALASNHAGLFLWPEAEKWDGYFRGVAPGGGVLLVGAAAAFAVSWPQIRSTAGLAEPVTDWVQTLSSALMVCAAASAVFALSMVLYMAADDFSGGAAFATILALAIGAAAGYGTTLVADARKNRVVLLGILGGIVVVGFIVMGIVNGEDIAFPWVNTGWHVAAGISLPALGVWALVGPPEVRTAFGPLVTPKPAQAGPPPGYPQQPPAPGYPQQPYGRPPPPAYPPQQPPPQAPPPPQEPPNWGPPPSQ